MGIKRQFAAIWCIFWVHFFLVLFQVHGRLPPLRRGQALIWDVHLTGLMDAHLASVRAAKERKEREAERARKAEEARMTEMLLEAAFDGEIETVQECLEWGLGADCTGEGENSPLSEAACGGAIDVVELLLKADFDPNSRGEYGRTPMYRAMFNEHDEVVRLLLQNAGDPRMVRMGDVTAKSTKAIFDQWDIQITEELLRVRAQAAHERFKARQAQAEAKVVSLSDEMAELERRHQQHVAALQRAFDSHKQWEHQLDVLCGQCGRDGYKNPALVPKAEAEFRRAEAVLAEAKARAAETEELLLVRRQDLRQAEATLAGKDALQVGTPILLGELEGVIIQDRSGKIAEAGLHVLIIDPTRMANKLLQYVDIQYLSSLYPRDMDPENLRYMIVRAIRFGNAMAFDLMDMDHWTKLGLAFDKVQKGLWARIIDRSIITNKVYEELLTDEEKEIEEFKSYQWVSQNMDKFRVVLVTNAAIPDEFMIQSMNTFRVKEL